MKWRKKLTAVQIVSLIGVGLGLMWFIVMHESLIYGRRALATVVSSYYHCTGRSRHCRTEIGVIFNDEKGVQQSSRFYRIGHDQEKVGAVIPINYLPSEPKTIESIRLYELIFDPTTLWFGFAILFYLIGRPFEKMHEKDRKPFPTS